MSKYNFPIGASHVPQMDFSITFNQNGGVSATQSFHAEKRNITFGSPLSAVFTQGNLLYNIDPNCPVPYRNLKLVSFTASDVIPGIVAISCEFSGYEFAQGESGGGGGIAPVIETYTLRGTIEEKPLNQHKKWVALDPSDRTYLGGLMTGKLELGPDLATPGSWVVVDDVRTFYPAVSDDGPVEPFTGNALVFALIISEGQHTYKGPAWTYSIRTEGDTSMTSGQMNALGKYANPPGPAPKPTSGWAWMLIGPDQEQVGNSRFIKDFNFQLVDKNEINDFLYS